MAATEHQLIFAKDPHVLNTSQMTAQTDGS